MNEANFCGTRLPWLNAPFRLISWFEMTKFTAEKYLLLGGYISEAILALGGGPSTLGKKSFAEESRFQKRELFAHIEEQALAIGLTQTAKMAGRLFAQLSAPPRPARLAVQIEELRHLMEGEMASQLFLWAPSHRSAWYGKHVSDIIGEDGWFSFPKIATDMEEAAKCYALGRFTACAYHLMRSTEIGVTALSKAIGHQPTHRGWGEVFKEVERQSKMQSPPPHWKGRRKFFNQLSGDLCALTKAWRNDVAHLVAVYGEDDATELLTVVPMFLKDLATQIDENGKLLSPLPPSA